MMITARPINYSALETTLHSLGKIELNKLYYMRQLAFELEMDDLFDMIQAEIDRRRMN
jgi:hypothetical protein